MFSPNQVGELIVGGAVASEVTVKEFISTASNAELGIFGANGGEVKAKQPFYFLQKTNGDEAKGLNFEFSDKINPKNIEKITVKEYKAEAFKSVKVKNFEVANVITPNRTYEIEIRVKNQLSPENFEQIMGYYITGEVLGSDTAATVRDGLIFSLNKNLERRGSSEFIVVASNADIVITEKAQKNVPGKIPGRKLDFDVIPKVFNNISTGVNSNLGLLESELITKPYEGVGTGKWATNAEWFLKGYKYDANRQFGYPADFTERVPFYTEGGGTYNVLHIKYFTARTETSVERQYKVLTVLIANADKEVTNAILDKLKIVDPASGLPEKLIIN